MEEPIETPIEVEETKSSETNDTQGGNQPVEETKKDGASLEVDGGGETTADSDTLVTDPVAEDRSKTGDDQTITPEPEVATGEE